METNATSSLFELQVDHESTAYLKEAARWAKFLAIVGFIFCGLFAIFGLFAGSLIGRMYSSVGVGQSGAMGGAFFSIVYILIALLYFFPCLYTFNFAKKMQVALASNDQAQLNQSFRNLKACYRFLGILMVICLSLWGLGIIFAIIGAAFR
ncbi:MAG: hypothetical protein BGO55_02425 [Sphingobacteriales bacterium 50-39]|nr:hypothetical protein [Sphingobacteriales bacterium]OJW55418.1 MAG: hypothetical protein BGO55_02425 [Sphingobacteriales bacterium 50-39]